MQSKNSAVFQSATPVAASAGIISLEMMIVVGILIVLLLGAGARIVIALLANDNAAEMSNVQALYSALKDIKTTAGYGAPGTELSEAVIAAGSVPGNMTVHDNAIQNQWGGVYALTSTGQGFTIRDPDIPDKNCIKIAHVQKSAIRLHGQVPTEARPQAQCRRAFARSGDGRQSASAGACVGRRLAENRCRTKDRSKRRRPSECGLSRRAALVCATLRRHRGGGESERALSVFCVEKRGAGGAERNQYLWSNVFNARLQRAVRRARYGGGH